MENNLLKEIKELKREHRKEKNKIESEFEKREIIGDYNRTLEKIIINPDFKYILYSEIDVMDNIRLNYMVKLHPTGLLSYELSRVSCDYPYDIKRNYKYNETEIPLKYKNTFKKIENLLLNALKGGF